MAISLLAFLYSLVQSLRLHFHRLRTGVDSSTAHLPGIGDFIGDQVCFCFFKLFFWLLFLDSIT